MTDKVRRTSRETTTRPDDRAPDPSQSKGPSRSDKSTPTGQDEKLIGAERFPRKGDDE
jgi:hypothetical protein